MVLLTLSLKKNQFIKTTCLINLKSAKELKEPPPIMHIIQKHDKNKENLTFGAALMINDYSKNEKYYPS